VYGIRPTSSLALALLTGCSFMMVKAPGKQPAAEIPRCSRDRFAVVADGVLTATYGVTALAMAGNDAGNAVVIPLAAGGFHLASMLAGNNRIKRCQSAYEAHEAWLVQARQQMDTAVTVSPAPRPPAITAPAITAPAITAPAITPPATARPVSASPVTAQAAGAPPASTPPAAPVRPPPTPAAPAARPDTSSRPPAEGSRKAPATPSDEPWADFWVRPQ
jgi:hypothetical protein